MSDSVRPGTALDQLLERCAQLRQPRRLAEHAIDVIRQFAFTPYAVSPTGEENDGRVRGRALHHRGNGPAIDVRHSEIRDYRLEALALLACRRELIDAPLAAVDGQHGVAVGFENVLKRFEQERIVVHEQYAQASWRADARRRLLRVPEPRGGKDDAHRRARPELALDLELRAVSLHHAVDHGEPQARAPLAFGREEGLETAASDRLGHAHTRVADLDLNLRRGARFAVGAVTDARAQRERAALRHGIDRGQDQVSERVATRHLPECPPPLLLHHRLLRLTQVLVRPLQSGVEPHLTRGECQVLAQLTEELAIGARKASRLAPGCDHDAEDPVLDAQGDDHQGTQATTRETCGQGE